MKESEYNKSVAIKFERFCFAVILQGAILFWGAEIFVYTLQSEILVSEFSNSGFHVCE